MGVDLCLIPVDSDLGDWSMGHSLLEVERRSELWNVVEALAKHDLPTKFQCFKARNADGDPCYGTLTDDCYGNLVKCATAGDLAAIQHQSTTDHPRNRAIWAFLRELPPETKIALYWH